jgi:hypothetical protein
MRPLVEPPLQRAAAIRWRFSERGSNSVRGTKHTEDDLMKKMLLALAVAATFAAGSVSAQRPGDRLLGVSTLASHEGDVDRVPVSCRSRVAAVKLRSANGPAEVERIWLTYGNGQREQVSIHESLRRGESTGWIDVAGGRRCVVSVAVQGDAERRGEHRRTRWDDDDDYRNYDTRYDPRYEPRHDGYDDRRGRRPTRPVDIEIYGRSW